MTEGATFKDHVQSIVSDTRSVLVQEGHTALVIHAGTPTFYTADDQEIPFRSLPHFKRFVPLESPHHIIVITLTTTTVIEVHPDDYWEERGAEDPFWKDAYERVITIKSEQEAWAEVPIEPGTIFIGDRLSSQEAAARGIRHCNKESVVAFLDEGRSIKTPYEIACISYANQASAAPHQAARDAFLNGASELDIQHAFIEASGTTESDLAYPSIVALNEKGATLHYRRKRSEPKNGSSFLIDAGLRYRGYAADISRTYAREQTDPRFHQLISSIDTLQKNISNSAIAGNPFIELHHRAHQGVFNILKLIGVMRCEEEEALSLGLTKSFFPHGLGHMLGIQVHDVGNSSAEGMAHPLKAKYPLLRTNRTLVENMVTTIEPGIYFNDILLEDLKRGPGAKSIDWDVVSSLQPYGGVRIEDNIVVRKSETSNLTRPFLP